MNQLEWNPKHTALLIVDVQNDYCHKEGSLAQQDLDVSMVDEMMPNLKDMIASMKDINVPIIYIQTIHEDSTDSETWIKRLKGKNQKGLCRKDTWGAEILSIGTREE